MKRYLPLLLCLAYLPATSLPCPAPGLDRSRPSVQEPAVPEPAARNTHAGHHRSDSHDAHAHHAPAPEGVEDPHAGHAGMETPVVESPAAAPSSTRIHLPCPCGCGERARSVSSGKLGPVLVSVSEPERSPALSPRDAEPLPWMLPAPADGLDPIPI